MALAAPQKEPVSCVLCLRFLSLSCGWESWSSQERVSAEYSSVLQVCPSRVTISTDWSVPEQGVVSHCSWSWGHPPGFSAFLGLELKYN